MLCKVRMHIAGGLRGLRLTKGASLKVARAGSQ